MEHNSTRFDVAIIGGGPAGVAAALTAIAAGMTVAIISPQRSHRSPNVELLSGRTCSLLHELGVFSLLPDQGAVECSGIWSSWDGGSPVERLAPFMPRGAGWVVDRTVFDDAMLAVAKARGAQRFAGLANAVEFHDDGDWRVAVQTEAGRLGLRSRLLVLATGRGARLRQSLGAIHRCEDDLVAFQLWDETLASVAARDHMLTLAAAERGWWYALPHPAGGTFTGYCTSSVHAREVHASDLRQWPAWHADTPVPTSASAAPVVSRRWRGRSASVGWLQPGAGHQWAAVGDAACAVDPLSGQGVAFALESGMQAMRLYAAVRLLSANWQPEYLRWLQEVRDEHFQQRRQHYLASAIPAPFWQQRRAGSLAPDGG